MKISDKHLLANDVSQLQNELRKEHIDKRGNLPLKTKNRDENEEASQALFLASLKSNVDAESFSSFAQHINSQRSQEAESLFTMAKTASSGELSETGTKDYLSLQIDNKRNHDSQSLSKIHLTSISSEKLDTFVSLLAESQKMTTSHLRNPDALQSNRAVSGRELLPSPNKLLMDLTSSQRVLTSAVEERGLEPMASSQSAIQTQWGAALDLSISQLLNAHKSTDSAAAWLKHFAEDIRLVQDGSKTNLSIKLDHNVLDGARLRFTLNGENIRVDLLLLTDLLPKDSLIALQTMLEDKYPQWKFVFGQRLDSADEQRSESNSNDAQNQSEEEEQRDSEENNRERKYPELSDELL